MSEVIATIFEYILLFLFAYFAASYSRKNDKLEQKLITERAEHNMLKDVIALPIIWEYLSEETRNFLRKDFGIRQYDPMIFSSHDLSPEEKENLRKFATRLQGTMKANDVVITVKDFKSNKPL